MTAASEVSSLELTLTQTDTADPQEERCGFCGVPSVVVGFCVDCPLLKKLKEEEDELKANGERKEGGDPEEELIEEKGDGESKQRIEEEEFYEDDSDDDLFWPQVDSEDMLPYPFTEEERNAYLSAQSATETELEVEVKDERRD